VIREDRAACLRLLALHQGGGYTPVLGAVLPMAQIVAAHALASSGRKVGNVVVRPSAGV